MPIPRHCKFFLCVNEYKAQLFQLAVAERIPQANLKQFVVTKDAVIVPVNETHLDVVRGLT